MSNFISNQLLLYIAIALVLFVPGFFLMRAIWRKETFSPLEQIIVSFGFSLTFIDFYMILIGRMGIPFTLTSLLLPIVILVFSCHLINIKRFKSEEIPLSGPFIFSKNQTIIIILIFFLTIFTKVAYLDETILPTSTDLGHHMYWSKLIAENGELPVYQERDIIEVDGKYQISEPKAIPDVIIGEHLPFAAIAIISGANFISSFPALILFLSNIIGILTIFVLSLKLFEKYSFGKNAAILVLFLVGPLWSLSSPQAKFISGGVVGNMLGNFLIPLALYFFFISLTKKKSGFLTAAIAIVTTLFYTHHLSAFILLFILFFSFLYFAIINIKDFRKNFRDWIKLILAPKVLLLIFFILIVLLPLYTPSYIATNAVETAVGEVTKVTRAGLSFGQLSFGSGEARMALGLFGLLILLFSKMRGRYSSAFIVGWTVSILIMSWKPALLGVNINSGRVAAYLLFPLAISSGFALAWILDKVKNSPIKRSLLTIFIFLIIIFLSIGGFYDNSQTVKQERETAESVETFQASEYLSQKTNEADVILKDHNYLEADAWIKLYIMKGYNYPLSRGLFKRYEDSTKPREMCTLWMISTPNTEDGGKCYSDLGVNFVMVNAEVDSSQFRKSENFDQVYRSNNVVIFHKK